MDIVLFARLLFLGYLVVVAYAVYRAVTGQPRWYWITAALVYVGSTPFAMSIGVLMVAGAFAAVGAALAHSIRAVPSRSLTALGACVGLCVWAVWLLAGNLTWVFWPLLVPLDWLLA